MSKCPKCGSEFKGRSLGSHARKCDVAPEQLFWARVRKGENCWIFEGCKDKWGYGHFGVKGHRKQAHRMAYELTYGPIPEGKLVMHSCDTPACVNPAHLKLGTDKDNHADAVAKGRHTFGERTKRNKLTEAQVLEIKRRYKRKGQRSNSPQLAAEFGVTKTTITCIMSGAIWKHLI